MTDEAASFTSGAPDTSEGIDSSAQDWSEDSDFVSGDAGRFDGDEGTWEPALRDAVVHLYKRRFISKAQHPQHWEPLVRNLSLVRADLNNHNLILVIDTTREVMFKQQAPIEDGARQRCSVMSATRLRRLRFWSRSVS